MKKWSDFIIKFLGVISIQTKSLRLVAQHQWVYKRENWHTVLWDYSDLNFARTLMQSEYLHYGPLKWEWADISYIAFFITRLRKVNLLVCKDIMTKAVVVCEGLYSEWWYWLTFSTTLENGRSPSIITGSWCTSPTFSVMCSTMSVRVSSFTTTSGKYYPIILSPYLLFDCVSIRYIDRWELLWWQSVGKPAVGTIDLIYKLIVGTNSWKKVEKTCVNYNCNENNLVMMRYVK